MHLTLSVQFKLTRVGKIQRTKTKRKKMFHSVILNDIKRLLINQCIVKLQFFPHCFGSANITVGQRRFVFFSIKEAAKIKRSHKSKLHFHGR